MTQGTGTSKGSRAEQRRARLAAELRANLKKRKDQARVRREGSRAEAGSAAGIAQGRDKSGQS
jgi:hypothetical protein